MKVTKTYSIEENIYNAFDNLTNEKNINKSSFFEEVIKKYLKDNDLDFIDKLYFLKSNPEHIVSVVAKDSFFYQLSDGSRINRILFGSIFDEVTPVEPEPFFNSTNKVFEDLTEKIKKIGTDETETDKIIREIKENYDGRFDLINQRLRNFGLSVDNIS